MTQAYYTSPTDIVALTKVRSVDLNTVDAAIEAAFEKVPVEADLKKGTVDYAVDTGTADAYLVALTYAPASYTDGLEIIFKATNANTGAATVNVNSLGVKSLRRQNGIALAAGDLVANKIYAFRYNATSGYFELQSIAAGSMTDVATVSGIAANVTTVAGISANVTSVAGNAANINTVAGISANVTTVAGVSAAVTTTAGISANVTAVAGNAADISAVAAIDADVTAVAAIVADVSTVAADGADIGTVATNIANVNAVGGISAAVTTVAGVQANVTTVAGISANVATVAGIAANVTTVAGVAADVSAVAAQAIGWTFSATTTMADPGSGVIRLNHATPASASAIALDDLNASAQDVSAFVITWGDSTNTNKGTLTLRQGTSFATYTVTGLTDNVGWAQLAVTYVAGGGSFSAAVLYAQFSRTGDAGAGGDFSSNTATSVDGEMVLFSGTGGKTGKRATTTGLLKATSGVVSAAVAGTDYQSALASASQAEMEAGTEAALRAMSPLRVAQAVAALGPDTMTATVGGLVPTPPNNTTTFLRGDGTFAAAGGGAWVFLSAVTASNSATVDIETTFDSTYDMYAIVASGITVQTSGILQAQLKISGAYLTLGAYSYHTTNTTSSSTAYAAVASDAEQFLKVLTQLDNTASSSAGLVMYVPKPSSTTILKHVFWHGGVRRAQASSNAQNCVGAGGYGDSQTGALTGVRFSMAAGNIVAGTFRLYGIKNS